MAVVKILLYPDARLQKPSREVARLDEAVRAVAQDLADTLYAGPGVGLSAPQIGHNLRLIVVDENHKKGKPRGTPLVLVNPRIARHEGERIFREGCLSVPEFTANVRRFDTVHVEALDLEGRKISVAADGFRAIILQHEIDHLDGILFIHRVPSPSDLIPRKKF